MQPTEHLELLVRSLVSDRQSATDIPLIVMEGLANCKRNWAVA